MDTDRGPDVRLDRGQRNRRVTRCEVKSDRDEPHYPGIARALEHLIEVGQICGVHEVRMGVEEERGHRDWLYRSPCGACLPQRTTQCTTRGSPPGRGYTDHVL